VPVCAEFVGLSVAGKPTSRHAGSPPLLLDAHGDALSSVALGDNFKARHDAIKYTLYGLAKWAHVGADVEVFGLFRDVIPQPVRTRLEAGVDPRRERRERDGLVPDFRFQGGYVGIAELKIIGRNKTHYPTEQHPDRGRRVRPTDRRASQIQPSSRVTLRRSYRQDRLPKWPTGRAPPLVRACQGLRCRGLW